MFPFSSLNDTNFADEVIDDQYYCNNNEINSLINPSQMPDNAYECFRRRGLHFIHVNARSLFYKMSEIRKLVQKSNPAILSVTETWFDTSVTDNSIEIEKYNIIRRDRQSRWGGVCMYIRSDLAYNRKNELENDNFEDLWLELLLPKSKPIFVGTCYRAPKNNKLLNSLETTFSKLQPDDETIILGDFNICLLKNSNLNTKYIDILNSNNFSQLIKEPTRVTQKSLSLIDHIHSNITEKICQSGVIKSGISDHYIIYRTRKVVRGQINTHNTVKIRSMKYYSKDRYIEILKSLNWSVVTNCVEVNSAVKKLKNLLTYAMDKIAPEKEVRIKVRTEPWMNNEILELIYERDKALIQSNNNKTNPDLRKNYNKLRNKLINLIRNNKANFFQNKVDEHKNNPKLLWKQFKTLGYSNKSKGKSRIVLEINGEKCHDPKTVSNHMNTFFLTVASKLQRLIINVSNIFNTTSQIFKDFYSDRGITPKSFNISEISEEFVYKELCNLDPTKSTGIDGIKPLFLKDGAEVIKSAVTHLINLSIKSQVVPDELKSAIVKPLYKKIVDLK